MSPKLRHLRNCYPLWSGDIYNKHDCCISNCHYNYNTCHLILIFWVHRQTFRSVEHFWCWFLLFLLLLWGGKTKSAPWPFDLDWTNELEQEFDNIKKGHITTTKRKPPKFLQFQNFSSFGAKISSAQCFEIKIVFGPQFIWFLNFFELKFILNQNFLGPDCFLYAEYVWTQKILDQNFVFKMFSVQKSTL